MQTRLRKIGNSRGIIIPAPFLTACGINSDVELRIDGKALILESPKKPRPGWFADTGTDDPALNDAALWDAVDVAEDSGEWEW
jgi:antitoxin MazE